MDESRLNFLKEQMESPYATVRESTWKFHSDPQPDYGIVDESLAKDRAQDWGAIDAANGVKPLNTKDGDFMAEMKNTNAYKKYFYSHEDVLQEAKKISAATHIPENAILANADNLNNARDVYNYQQRAMNPQAVFRAYPELSELAKKSDTDAAIALHNLKNVRQTQGIIEAAKTGWELDRLMSERGRLGYSAMNGKSLTEADLKRLEEIEAAQKNSKELPGLFDDPFGAIVGGTVQSGKMMLRNALNGQKMGVYGAGFGALAGALIGGGSTLGAGTGAGAAAGARIGYSVGSRIGMAQDMYDEIAGNNYLDYKNYKDKHGKQLLTDNQARAYAAAAAAVETGIEFTNANKILGIVKGGAGAQSLKNIIASAKDSTELQSLLAAYVRNGMKNIGEVTLSESAEEGVQEMSNSVITNIAASNNPGGDIPTYSPKDIIAGGLEASWQALPTSIGFGASAHAASNVSYARRMAATMELKSEEDKANLRTANGLSLLRNLSEDLKTNELFKKSPEIYRDILKSQLKGTDLETIHIDTEMVLNQEGGYELLKEVADKAGVSEEQFNNIVETKADMHIDVADYAEKVLKYDLGAKLEEYITFDDIGESLARNRQYASRMRREMDKILAFEERQREDALNTYLDNNFPEQEQREIAEAVIRRFPDNPKEGVKVIRQSLQDKIDTPLKEIIEQLKEGAGKGVSIHTVDKNGNLTSRKNSAHGKGVFVSNNAPWYRKWFKEHGRKPSEKEYRDLARDIYTGHNPYGLENWENRSAEENQRYEENKATMEATEQAIARLDALTPALEKIDPGELTITEGLSEEAFEVYREMRKKLFEGAGGEKLKKKAREKARQEAQMNAILFARMADRMAEWHRQAGQTKYTAKDFARSVGVEFGGKAAGQKFNQASMNTVHIGTETYVQRSAENVLDSYYKLTNQEAYPINYHIKGDDFETRKENARIIYKEMYKNEKGKPIYITNGYKDDIEIPFTAFKEIAKHARKDDLFEVVPFIEQLMQKGIYLYTRLPEEDRNKKMKADVVEYRGYGAKLKINETEYFAKIVVRKEKSNLLKLHDIDISKIKNEASDSGNGGADYYSASKPDKLASAKYSIPWWLNEVKTKLIDNEQRYDQAAGEQKGLYKIKGQTAFKANGEKIISLFKAADQSTFMHEMAHVYLHDMFELAKLPNAPQRLLDDVKTLSEWASWRPETFDKEYKGTALEREFRKMHEQIADATKYGYLVLDGRKVALEQLKLQWAQERFARGFENYLREGKAPTESVKTIFRRFKEWLGTIYKAFIQIGGAPSKEVCAVMDRMIASEEEIDIAMSKKGVDSFADAGGMEYLEGNAKQIYMRMVERAKAEAKEKVLKIALKDVKEDYRKQEKEFFAQEEAEYREKLQAEPVFVIQEHINNNPDLSTSAICETLGMSVEEYVAKLKEYGGSLDAAVKAHMREFKKGIDNSGFDAQYFREKAEALVEESKYRKLASTMELNIFEQLAKAQKKINAQSVKNMTLTNDEKGVMGTVDKLNKQSQKIEKLEAEKKEEAAKHREEKKELREKLEAEKKEGIAKHREEKEQIIANVRGLRDAALKHYQEFAAYVERKLETMPIEDANNYQMWRRKSAEAQHNSERAIVTGKWELAVKYKRAQVIYDMFADRAVRNDKKIKKIEEQLTKRRQSIIKNKNISANERYAYNHMLYVFGFVDADAPMPPRYQEENGFIGVLQKSDAPREVDGLFMECPFFTADGFLNLPEWLVSAAMGTAKREQRHKDLSNEQMKMLAQVMNIIYKRGVDDMTLKTIKSVDGRQMSVDDAIAEITAQVRQRIVERTVRDTTGAGDMTKREEAERSINDANQYLIKPEVILKKMGDLAVKYIYEPLKIAADKELRMAGDMQKKLQNLYNGYSAEELYAMRNDAKYKFGTSMITKEKVIMLALNWGTEINAKRVMDGFHVSKLDVKNALANLTEQDWNLVNDIWSLYDEHWDEVRDIEARMTGAVLEKQPNRAFTIIGNDGKSYTLEGGYFPIKYDPRDQRTQEQKADAAAMQQASMSNVAMSLGKGFLKDRTNAKVERRLDLRFEIISGSLADVIHLIAFREPIRDVRRIVLRDDFRSLVNSYLGEAEYKHLRKWTTDCWAEEPIAQSRFEIVAAKLRNAQTMGMMSFRVMTAALNIANAPIVAHYMGTVDMLHALKRFYSAPRQYIDFIFRRSVFMAERAETMDANIYDAIKGPHFMDNVPGVGKAGKFLREHAFKLITWTDLMLALPLWQHEYEKAYNDAVENGRSPQQAQDAGVSAGDAAVRWCFGSGRTIDKAAVQRGRSEFMKQLTMYYSYMSTVYNALNYELWGAKMGYKQAMTWADANKNKELLKAVVKAGSALLAWQLLPAVITALFRAGTSGDDDDLEPEKLLKSIASETLSTLVGGIPVLRDAVPYLLARAFDEKQFAPRIPIQNTIEQTNRVIQSITNDKKTFGDVMRESGKLLSQTTGAPSTLIDALTTSVTYLETGFDADVSEYLRALILDKKLKNKK